MNIENINWDAVNQDVLSPIQKRQLNYPQISDADFGHLYDIVTVLIETLEANGIEVPVRDNDKARLEHRKLIKERIPKV